MTAQAFEPLSPSCGSPVDARKRDHSGGPRPVGTGPPGGGRTRPGIPTAAGPRAPRAQGGSRRAEGARPRDGGAAPGVAHLTDEGRQAEPAPCPNRKSPPRSCAAARATRWCSTTATCRPTRRCGRISSSPPSEAPTPTAGSSTAWEGASRRSPRCASSGRRRAPTRTWTTPSARSRWTARRSTGAATAATCPRPSDPSRWTRASSRRPARKGVVVIHNTNTGKLIRARFPVEDGRAAVEGDTAIPGVSGTGAPVDLEFLDPGGAGTGVLLPTGNVLDILDVEGVGRVPASLVDAANAFVFVDADRRGDRGNGDAGRPRHEPRRDGPARAGPRRGRGRDGDRGEPRRGVRPVPERAQDRDRGPAPAGGDPERGGDRRRRGRPHRAHGLDGQRASRPPPHRGARVRGRGRDRGHGGGPGGGR